MLPTLPDNNKRAQLYWLDPQTLGIRWADGTKSNYSLDVLRRHCPCARCQATRQNPLTLRAKPQGPLRVLEAQPIGRYAVQIVWNDGHRTGIYTYDRLKNGF